MSAHGCSEATRFPGAERYAESTVLVTGGSGFIGSALVNALSKVSCQIVLLLRPGRKVDPRPNSKAKLVPVYGDIQDRKTWNKVLAETDYVFHFAAQTSAYAANKEPLSDLQTNVIPVIQLLEACRDGGFKPKIMFAGTVTQAGLPERCPVDEDVQDLPLTVYDIHKLTSEKYLQFYAQEAGIPAATLRLSNVYGPGSGAGNADRGVLNLMIKKGVCNEPLTVYGDGSQIRDYVFIEDVVRAFLAAGSNASALSGNYYVVGSGQGSSIMDAFNLVAERVHQVLGQRPAVDHVPSPVTQNKIEERNFVADATRFREASGWEPEVSLSEGIDRTIEYLVRQGVAGDPASR